MFNGDPETQPLSESSEMGEEAADGNGTTQPQAADGTGTTPPPTQQPVQDMSQVMQMMGQLITAQRNSQDAMLKLMADREASSSSRSITGLSSLARSVDTRGVLKCEEYHGDKEKFMGWKKMFYSTLELIDPLWVKKLRTIEVNLDDKFELKKMANDEERDQAKGVSAFLIHLCRGDAATRINSSEDGNGFEMWRMLCRGKLARSSTAAMNAIMNPIFTSEDPRIRLQVWDKDVERFEARFRETVPDSLRKSIYQEKIAPVAMHERLLLNQGRFPTSDEVKEAIEDYLDAKEESDQTRSTTEQFVAGIGGKKGDGKNKDKKGGVRNKFLKDKDKGKKGSDKHGKSKDDGKGGDKGKLHKGLGKNPGRSEAYRFGGKCNWCWRVGHKEAQCWFRSAYDQYNGKEKQQRQENPQKPGDAGSADIRNYMQNKRARSEPAAAESPKMDIGGIWVEERFIYALFNGEFDGIEFDGDPESEEWSDDANCQSAWWKTYIEKQWQPEEPHEESSSIGEQHRGMRLGPVIEETDEDMLDSSIVDKYESHWNEEDDVIQQFLENDPYNSQGLESGGTKWWCDSNDPEEESGGTKWWCDKDQWSQIEQSRDDTTVTPTEVESNDHFIFSCLEDAQYGDTAEARRDDDDAQSMTVPQHAGGIKRSVWSQVSPPPLVKAMLRGMLRSAEGECVCVEFCDAVAALAVDDDAEAEPTHDDFFHRRQQTIDEALWRLHVNLGHALRCCATSSMRMQRLLRWNGRPSSSVLNAIRSPSQFRLARRLQTSINLR